MKASLPIFPTPVVGSHAKIDADSRQSFSSSVFWEVIMKLPRGFRFFGLLILFYSFFLAGAWGSGKDQALAQCSGEQ